MAGACSLAGSLRVRYSSVWVPVLIILGRLLCKGGLIGAGVRFLVGAPAFDTSPDAAEAGLGAVAAAAALFAASGEGSSLWGFGGAKLISREIGLIGEVSYDTVSLPVDGWAIDTTAGFFR